MSERSPRPRRGRLAALAVAGLVAGAVALWHVSPVLLWHLRFAEQLGREDHAGRLHSELRTALPASPPSWARLTMGGLSASVPLPPDERARCGECALRCVLKLEGSGSFAVFDGPLPEAYDEMLDRFAPDADDLSLFRSVASNWRTIDALTDRVRHRGALPESWRFQGADSRGVVTAFHLETGSRWVVYAFDGEGRPSRMIGVTGTSEDVFTRILGSLGVSAPREQESTCR